MDQSLRRKLDRITDILWAGGVTNPVTYIEQISYLIYLKLLDEEEAARELRGRLGAGGGVRLFPRQAERYRWSKWRFRSGNDLRDFVRDEVFAYMASLVKDEPQVAEYFRDAVLEIVDPNVLKQVIDELDSIDFRKLGPDVKGDIFEYLLTHLGQSALNGQFRTPRQVRAFMVEMVAPELGDTVYDPASGTAGFLIDVVDYMLARYSEEPEEVPIYGEDWLERRGQTLEEARKEIPSLQIYRKGAGEKIPDWRRLEASIHGTDVSRQMMRISMMNLVLHGIRRANLKRANVLSEMSGLTEDDLHRRYRGDPLQPSLRWPSPQGVDPAGFAHPVEEERAAVPRANAPLAGPRRPLRGRRARRRAVRVHQGAQGLARGAAARVRAAGRGLAPGGGLQTLRRRQDLGPHLSPPCDRARRRPGGDGARLVLRNLERRLRPGQDPGRRASRDTGEERHPGSDGGLERVQGVRLPEATGCRGRRRARCRQRRAPLLVGAV